MTISYYPNKKNNYYSVSLKNNIKTATFYKGVYKKLYFKFFYKLNSNPVTGFIKTSGFGICFLIFVFVFWLFLFSRNISLDYQIYKLKKEINNLEKQIGLIQEKNFNSFSDDFKNWLKENNFEEVKNISYLDLSSESLVFRD